MDNNILLDEFKRFDTIGKEQQEKQEKTITLPSFVSTCLAPHEKCTGSYEDTFHLFKLRCNCPCGHKSTHRKGKAGAERVV